MAGLTEQERAIQEQRAALWHEMEPIVSKLGKGERLTPEERKSYVDRDDELVLLDKALETVRREQGTERDKRDEADSRGISTDEAQDQDARESRAFQNY